MSEGAAPRKELAGPAKLLVDLGPLLIYLAAFSFTKDVFVATAIFMAATLIAVGWSWLKTRRVSAMLAFSGIMVLLLGGLTVWLHDATFIKMKPTIYYLMVAAILFFGVFTGRQLLKSALGQAFPGLSDLGWTKLTRNWAFFFVAMAVVNELVWRSTSTQFWLGYKLWGALPMTLLFTLANLPMMMRHGFSSSDPEDEVAPPPQG